MLCGKIKRKVPIRFWIGCMVFFTTYIDYTTLSNMSINIVSMVTAVGEKNIPECLLDKSSNVTQDTTLPDHGSRHHWDERVQSYILGAWFWGHALLSLPGGFIAEWLGPYWTIISLELIAGVMNSICVFTPDIHWGLLVFCRFIIGVCSGPIYPALLCLIARWSPPVERGKFFGALMGNMLGTTIAWSLVGATTQAFGWAWGFHVVTIQKIIFVAIFAFITADSPADHRFITEEEKLYILQSQEGYVTKTKAVPPYLKILTSQAFWALQIAHFGNLYGLYLQITTIPKYLSEVIGFDIQNAGFLASLPHIMRIFSGMGFGAFADFLKKKKGVPDKFIRKFFIIFSHIIPGICMFCVIFCGCYSVPVVVLLVLSQSINGAAVVTNITNSQDLSPNFSGTIFGIISFLGGMTGFIVPAITAALTQDNNGLSEYKWVFIIGGCMYVGCGLVFIFFGKTDIQPWNEKKDDPEADANKAQFSRDETEPPR